ncbi:MAG TPA: PKD domain-containing protein [Planctomycetota bacterium]|nr:PKD domain-containing protein [Planctomycetota bacterium]OQC18946.1 MAG: Inner spore coat protein H [Planctomycetes bacterium ADurb.Bin069]HNR97871.1 PKD domain-containing protein [Planctomycetota bacterium]HNU24602.1 PKD domain-containing protein [Planctomycetota bacterium]HOE29006.1 PKD domain-containing protein [Planctomycetota bacterium]
MRNAVFAMALAAAVCAGAADVEDVVFTEIMYNPGPGPVSDPDNEALEYIELHNRGGFPVDLGGWYFSNGIDYTFSEGVVLEAGAYLVVAKDPARIQAEHGISNVVGPFSLRLDDGGEKITLKLPPVPPAAEGLTVEALAYDDEPPWPAAADGTGASLQRINPFWSNDAPGNWEAVTAATWLRYEFTGTATSSVVYLYLSGAGEALVDDVELRPLGGGDNRLAAGDFEGASLAPWIAAGNHAGSFQESTRWHGGARSLHIVAAGAGDGGANGVRCSASPSLQAGAPYIITAWVRFLSGNARLRIRLSGSGIDGAAEPVMQTPGRRNAVWSLDAPPSLHNPYVTGDPGDPNDPGDPDHRGFIFHQPAMPRAGEAVGFRLGVRDDHDSVAAVTLHYDDGGGEASVAMFDDGNHGDKAAGDGIWGATLAPRPVWTIVKYWFTARDAAGHVRRFPREGDPSAACGYMVYPEQAPGALPLHCVFMAPSDLDWLNAHKTSDLMVPATIVYNGEVWDNATARYRGGSARTWWNWTKPNWKFKFPAKDHRFCGYPMELLDVFGRVNNTARGPGSRLRAINMNGSYGDKTFMREYLGYEQHRLAGLRVVPGQDGAPDEIIPGAGNYVTWVTMYMNGQYYGLFTYVEQTNEDYLDRNGFDKRGVLFKAGGSGCDADAHSGTGCFVQKVGPEPEGIAELGAYLTAVNTLSGAAMTAYAGEHMEIDPFLAYLAANTAMNNSDIPHKNYYLFQDYHGSGRRWSMLPWDLDLTFGRNWECDVHWTQGLLNDVIRWENHLLFGTQQYQKCDFKWNGIINAVLARTLDFRARYYATVARHLDTHFRQQDMIAEIEFLREKLRGDVLLDRAKWGAYNETPPYDYDFHVDELERFVGNRIANLRGQLAAVSAPPIQNLTCAYNAAAQSVALAWTIPGAAYEEVRVYRDGERIAVLPGTAVSTVTALPGGRDYYVFRVASVWGGYEHAGLSCLVVATSEAWVTLIDEDFSGAHAGQWQCNGSAALSGGTLRLTPAQAEQAGAAFYTTRFPSGDFRAFLDLTIAGGPEGGEGATFLWIRDETAEGALGGTGGALGFWGGALTGYAVEFDTVLSPDFGDPSGNHAALNDSRSGDGHSLAAFDLPVPLKGTGTFHVEVGCLQGLVTVTVANPAQGYGPACVLEHQIPSYIAGQAFFGFSGATGSLASEQRIDNFVLQIPNIPPDPPVPEFTAAPTRGTAPLTSMFTNLTTGEVQSFLWDFGDNLTSTRENPVHTYTAPGTYTVRLTATGPGGTAFMEKAGYITVVASEAPEADFYGVPRGGAAPLLVRFFPVVSGGAVATYEWDFGDGTTSAAAYPEHAYEQAGAFTVTLRVSGPGGSDVAEKPEYIEVSPPPEPEPAFAASPTAGAVPLQTAFTNLTAYADRVDSWLWDFGDGATSTEANPVHRYIAAGLYSVRLTAFYGAKSRDSYREDYIDAAPLVRFTASVVAGQAPLFVAFTNQTTGGAEAWHWDFGDGASSTDEHATHEYLAPGVYTVALTAMYAGRSAQHVRTDYVQVAPSPVVGFSAAVRAGRAPLTVAFSNETTGVVDSWLWDFGDGGQSMERDPSHVYTADGLYTVRLTARWGGHSAEAARADYIAVSARPVAAFSAAPRRGEAPLAVVFTNESTGDIKAWYWDFGDGGFSTARDPTHAYQAPGVYSVRLTAFYDDDAVEAYRPDYIEVIAAAQPEVQFSAFPSSGEAPLTVAFTNETTGAVESWRWDFGDGAASPARDPVHEYREPGVYTVRLTAFYGGASVVRERPGLIEVVPPHAPVFVRGQANEDARVDLSDAVTVLAYLFGGKSVDCLDACDTNDDGFLNIADAVYLLAYLFGGGPPPPPPFPESGTDATPDALGCERGL